MDTHLRRLERAAAVGGPLEQERYRTARLRYDEGVEARKLTGPGSPLDQAVTAWVNRDLADHAQMRRFIHFLGAVNERYGTEFAGYCIGEWVARSERVGLPQLLSTARMMKNEGDNELALNLFADLKKAAGL